MARVMGITTPLGADVLLFRSMHAREELSRPSEYQINLLSEKESIDVDKILGKLVTVDLELHDGSTRYFNGYVTRFAQGAKHGRYFSYRADVRPWLWFLSRTSDCRIFQEKTVPDIVKEVFADHKAADFKLELTATYKKWTYCVQYRETDLNFVSRLLEEEGIYYYFRHTQGHDTLVLTDSTSKHTHEKGCDKLPYIAPGEKTSVAIDYISSWEFSREVQPGVYVHDDYDLERPGVELKTRKPIVRGYSPSDYEIYDYPGHYLKTPDGEQYAAVRIDEFGTQFEAAYAVTNARALAVGRTLKVEGCERADQNREYLVLSANYDLNYGEYESAADRRGASYNCAFVAMSTQQQFRPRRITPKPFMQGPQTAVVVGPAGDQIYTDKYGRVKVQFHWDRRGTKDQNSSCWIRVSHPWAGKGWGSVATPRIGHEVVVSFLEGDPDQPIITGRVYNGDNLPPFGFPAGAVLSGVKSDTHKGSGFNEMSLDDTAGKERVFIHGQYNMDTVVEHDQTSTIHNNRTDRVDVDDSESIGKNQKWDVGVNRDATIGANETLTVKANRTKSITGNETITVGGNRDGTVSKSETLTVALQRTHSVGINETISVGAAQEITVGAAHAVTVGAAQTIKVGANQSTSVGANQSNSIKSNQTTDVGANQSTSVKSNLSTSVGADESREVKGGRTTSIGKDDAIKVGKNFVVDAGDSIAIKTGSANIVMKKDGTITINGKDITIEGTGKINIKASSDIVMKGSKITQN